ncbi:SPRY domain-containing SOCS box protein 2 isoform X1 [Artibeus jamaicensis]|uniref:SPRY domain-containing SOCS box protein 2 isoform X1 n=2 Tax=Artibeus jamaicensis TaxID=9417 RepID=UPI00235B1A5B|nr:SPRY domain-containing SOCS box protein 2 isoform X1 [Artibeus jamaicensis]
MFGSRRWRRHWVNPEGERILQKRDAPARLFRGILQLLASMGQTALAGGGSSTPTPQALYPDHSRPEGLEELLSAPFPDLETQQRHGWNPRDCSENIEVKERGLCFERRPVAQSTDGARGKRGYSRGLHAWEISWPPEQRGTHAVVGVATALAPLQADHYAALLGSNSESWGWDIGRGKLYHQSKGIGAPRYPAGPQGEQLEVPERLLVVLDMEEGTLGYALGDTYLGPAFRGLKGRTLYPAVSAVWGQCQVRISYLGERRVEPHSLLHLSRLSVHRALGAARLGHVSALPLPAAMKRYLLYQRPCNTRLQGLEATLPQE